MTAEHKPEALPEALQERLARCIRAARSSFVDEILLEDSLDALLIGQHAPAEQVAAVRAAAPSVTSRPALVVDQRAVVAMARAVADDKLRRVAEVATHLLQEDPEQPTSPEQRVQAVQQLLHELTGGMRPRR